MSLTIVATVGGATSNSYVTVAEANTYMTSRLNTSAWDDADDSGIALAEATREIDLLDFSGARTDSVQALAWPRANAYDPDSPTQSWFDDDVIPTRVKNATCELALEFLRAGTTDISKPDTTLAVIRKRVDVLETEYAPTSTTQLTGLARYPRVLAMLRPLLVSGGGQITLVRG